MKEKTHDKLAILWSMFGAGIFGTIFMFGNLKITGNVAKVYNYVSSTWSYLVFFIGIIFVFLIIYGIYKGKFIKRFNQ